MIFSDSSISNYHAEEKNLVMHDYTIDSMSSEMSKYNHNQKLLKAPYIDKAGITIQVKP